MDAFRTSVKLMVFLFAGLLAGETLALRIDRMGTVEVQSIDEADDEADDAPKENAEPLRGKDDKLFAVGIRSTEKLEFIEGRCRNGGKFRIVQTNGAMWSWKSPYGEGEYRVSEKEGSAMAAFSACGETFSPYVLPAKNVVPAR